MEAHDAHDAPFFCKGVSIFEHQLTKDVELRLTKLENNAIFTLFRLLGFLVELSDSLS